MFALAMSPGDDMPDHEGIALLPDGTVAVSAEGTTRVPRQPPSVNIYSRYGDFVRRLAIPEKFVPEPTGQETRGARGNAGFESLTLTPDGKRLFTAVETALIQDGESATFKGGARTRILEFDARHGSYEPAREFAYDIEPLVATDFKAKSAFNGLVDMTALSGRTLLALERAFVEDGEDGSHSIATIRIFKIDLFGGHQHCRARFDRRPVRDRSGEEDAAAGSRDGSGPQPRARARVSTTSRG